MSGRSEHRKHVSPNEVSNAMLDLRREINRRLKEKGRGTFASKHELLGILEEEHREIKDAVHEKGDVGHKKLRAELLDKAVGLIFGVACIDAGTMDW